MDYIAYGKIADMVAEFGALDMGPAWITQWGYRYCSLIVGADQYDTTFYQTLAEAKDDVRNVRQHYGIKSLRI